MVANAMLNIENIKRKMRFFVAVLMSLMPVIIKSKTKLSEKKIGNFPSKNSVNKNVLYFTHLFTNVMKENYMCV